MKNSIRIIALLIVSFIVFTLLVGCSNDASTDSNADADVSTDTDASADSGQADKDQVASDEKITIRMIDSLANDTRTAAIQSIIDAYMDENPNVTVELISPPTDGADAKIQQMLMSGGQLDIVDTGNSFQACINNEWVQPLNSYLEGWDEYATLTTEAKSRMTIFSEDGETIWLVPYGIYEKLLFYRADWFEELGMETPETWQDIYDASIELINAGYGGWATRGGARGYSVFDLLLISYLGSDKLVDKETYTYFTKDGESIFGTEEALQALEFYKKLYTDASPQDSISWGFTEMVQGFMSGSAGILLQDNDVILSLQDGMEEGTWAATILPLGPSGQGSSPLGYGGWAMTTSCEHPQQTADLIMYLSSAENNGYFCQQTGLIPIHTSTFEESDFFSTGVYEVFSQMSSMEGKYVYSGGNGVGYDCASTFNTDRDEYLQKYLLGEIEAQDLLDYWAETWDTAYEEQGQLW